MTAWLAACLDASLAAWDAVHWQLPPSVLALRLQPHLHRTDSGHALNTRSSRPTSLLHRSTDVVVKQKDAAAARASHLQRAQDTQQQQKEQEQQQQAASVAKGLGQQVSAMQVGPEEHGTRQQHNTQAW